MPKHFDQVRLKSACSATKTGENVEAKHYKQFHFQIRE